MLVLFLRLFGKYFPTWIVEFFRKPTSQFLQEAIWVESLKLVAVGVQQSVAKNSHEPSTLCLLNAQSVRKKADIISNYLSEHDVDLACITETWLTPDDTAAMGDLTPMGYVQHSSHRRGRRGGGVCCIHKKGL